MSTRKVGQTDLVFGVRSGFISRPVHARLQVSVCSGCHLFRPGYHPDRHTPSLRRIRREYCTSSFPHPARQHPSYGDCLEVKREYCQNSSVLDCVRQCSQSAAQLYEKFLQVKQIGFVTLGVDPYAVSRGGCLELYYCNMVVWFWWDSSLIFGTVGLVMWPVKSSPKWPIMCRVGR